MFKIVVLFKCEDRTDAPVMAKLLKDLEMVIEEINTFEVNLDALGTETSYDYSLEGTFNTYEDYQSYIINPIHKEYVEKMKELGVKAVKVCFNK